MVDATDSTFETAVLARSQTVPVVVDLWAEWCEPCKTLGPILEKVVAETDGRVELVKIDVDANPQSAAAFQVQSIPAVFAIRNREVVDQFVGAMPEAGVRSFVERLVPPKTPADKLAELGTEDALRAALDLQADHPGAVVRLAELLVERATPESAEEALALLARIPETAEVRRVAAMARMGGGSAAGEVVDEGVETRLDALLERVKADETARQELLDLLEVLGPEDPRTSRYRRAMTSRLF